MMSTEALLGAWAAAGFSLSIYSFLYKDNPFFKFGEHVFVGVSMGYLLTITHYEVMVNKLYAPMVQQGKWWLIIPALLGLLMLSRFAPPVSWLSRISFAFILGLSSGVAIPRQISSFILQQVQGTMKPLMSVGGDGSVIFTLANFNTLLILVGVVSVLFYFFFSIEHTGAAGGVARIGIYFLMVSFGAAFGYTVMARMSLLIGRFDELILYASADYGYATLILLTLMIVGLAWWEKRRAKTSEGAHL
ncbi:MAG TPA: hypothetical protein VNN62_21205 [Methylomirabilota bacterium]|jgi:hypothetical protein|nr:hypothetical protein [Methylomirabilota bacterium]